MQSGVVASPSEVGLGRLASSRRAAALAAPLAVIALGLVVRVAYLGDPQLSRDEAASWYLASRPLGALLGLSSHETFPPLYLLILKAWMALFGDSEAALRSLSVVAGLVTAAVSWQWARDALGERAAVAVACLVALSPALVLDSRNARMYALEACFATTAWWLAWRLVARGPGWSSVGRRIAAVALVLVTAGEVWSMSFGIPIVGLQLLFALIAAAWLRSRAAVLACGCIALGGLSLAPWLPNLLAVAGNGQTFWTATPDLRSLAETVGRWLVGDALAMSLATRLLLIAGAILAVGMAIGGMAALWLGRVPSPVSAEREARAAPDVRPGRLFTLAITLDLGLVAVVWIYSQVRSIYDWRYLGSAFPALAIATVASLAAIAPRPRAGGSLAVVRRERLGLVAVLVVASTMLLGTANAVDGWRAATGLDPARQMTKTLAGLVRPGDVVVTLNAQTFFTLEYYLVGSGESARLEVPLYNWHRPSAAFFTGWRDIEDASIVDAARVARSGWNGAAQLAPGGSLWLVSLVDPAYEFPLFTPLRTGELREIRRIDVEGPGVTAQVREAVPASR